ncbi:hypothetical protein ES703_114179 [subsurface metagenome]
MKKDKNGKSLVMMVMKVLFFWGGGWGLAVVHKMWGFPGHLVHCGIVGGLV